MTVTTTQSYFSTRPIGNADRVRCVEFTEDLPSTGLHAVIAGTLAAWLPVVAGFDAARVANEAAATRLSLDGGRVDAASAAFTAAFNRWTLKIDDANDQKGYAAAALKPKLDDQSLSTFLGSTDWDKVARMTTVFAHVDEVPSLVGTPESYQALKTATTVLQEALGEQDRSRGARSRTVAALAAAEKTFDQVYGTLVKNIQRFDPSGLALQIPLFRRVRKVKGAEPEPEAPAPTTDPPTTEAEPPVPEPTEPPVEAQGTGEPTF